MSSTTTDLENAYHYLHTMQTNFEYDTCAKLFFGDADYCWRLWNGENRNIVYFLNRLDACNRAVLFNWGKNLHQSIPAD